ncbi:hypothetical protein DRQ15_10730 [candidate division KSB1 bacterium]|nr:MAG: hypothetical protein DRQ15_10730 [candidate division KSB1 bacterium]
MKHIMVLTRRPLRGSSNEADAYGYCGDYPGSDICHVEDTAHCEYADDICNLDNAACYYATLDECNWDTAGCEYYGGAYPGTDSCGGDHESGCCENGTDDYCSLDGEPP